MSDQREGTYVKVSLTEWRWIKRKLGALQNLNLLHHEKDLSLKKLKADNVKLKRSNRVFNKLVTKIHTHNRGGDLESLIHQFKSSEFLSDLGYGESVLLSSSDSVAANNTNGNSLYKTTNEASSVKLPDGSLDMDHPTSPLISLPSTELETLSTESSVSVQSLQKEVDFIPMGVSPKIFNAVLTELTKSKQLLQNLSEQGQNIQNESEKTDYKQIIRNLVQEVTILRNQLEDQQVVLEAFSRENSDMEKVVNIVLYLQETVQRLHKEVFVKTEMMKNLEKINHRLKEKSEKLNTYDTESDSVEISANVKLNVTDPILPVQKIPDDYTIYEPTNQFMTIKKESETQTEEVVLQISKHDRCHKEVQTVFDWNTMHRNEMSHTNTIEFLKSVLSKAQQKMASLEQEIEATNSELLKSKKEIKQLNDSKDQLQEELRDSYLDIETLTRIKEFHEASAVTENEKAIKFEAKLKIEKEENQKLQGTIKELREQVNKLAVENNFIRSHHPAFRIDSQVPLLHKSKSEPCTGRISVEESSKIATYDFAPSSTFRAPVELEDDFDLMSRGSSSDYRSISPAGSEPICTFSSGRKTNSDFTCDRCLRAFPTEKAYLQHYQKCID